MVRKNVKNNINTNNHANNDKKKRGDSNVQRSYEAHARSSGLVEMATRNLKGVDSAEPNIINGFNKDKKLLNGIKNGYKNGYKKHYENGHIEVSSELLNFIIISTKVINAALLTMT